MVQAVVEIITQTIAQVIHFLAFLTFSSSQAEIKYIIQAIIKDITEITATNWIQTVIIFHKNQKKFFQVTLTVVLSSGHQGNQWQTTAGEDANIFVVSIKYTKVNFKIKFFIINYLYNIYQIIFTI